MQTPKTLMQIFLELTLRSSSVFLSVLPSKKL
ncbi:hypothetical protein Gotri_003775, partial [Gossypium trilobum]|nr:hypothetical protein [Gossypium trilobum]